MSRDSQTYPPSIFKHPRRTTNWLVLGLSYWAIYAGRYNLPIVNETLALAYGWSKADVGKIISAGLLVYGISAFLIGPLIDRLGGRRGMIVGLSGSLVCNTLFGLGSFAKGIESGVLLSYFSVVWAVNGFFQAFCAVSLNKVNVGWFSVSERGRFAATFSVFLQIGSE